MIVCFALLQTRRTLLSSDRCLCEQNCLHHYRNPCFR